MAVLSTHLLNTYNGDHAGFVKIEIFQIKPNGKKKIPQNSYGNIYHLQIY